MLSSNQIATQLRIAGLIQSCVRTHASVRQMSLGEAVPGANTVTLAGWSRALQSQIANLINPRRRYEIVAR